MCRDSHLGNCRDWTQICRGFFAMWTAVTSLTVVSSFCPAQDALEPVTRQTVLNSARNNFFNSSQRNRFTRLTASKLASNSIDDEWFKGFRGVASQTNANFSVVASNIHVPEGRLVSMAGIATPGDVIRFDWRHNGKQQSHLCVYVDEGKFPGGTKTHSFFIYPYRTQLEYNTLPPRKHRQQMLDSGVPPSELVENFKFSDPDPQRAGMQWLRSTYLLSVIKVSDYPLFNSSTLVNGTAKATIMRGTGEDLSDLAFKQNGSFPAGIGSTSYRTEGEKIWITFVPERSPKVTDANRIGFVQVGRMLLNGKPQIKGKPIRSSAVLIAEAEAQLNSQDAKANEEVRRHWEYQLRRGKLETHMETDDGFFVDTVLANVSAKQMEPPLIFVESVEMMDEDERTPSYNRLGPEWYWVRNEWNESTTPPISKHTSAQLYDAPSLYFQHALSGCKKLKNSSSADQVIVEFEVWAWCEKGAQAGQFFDGLLWEYHLPEDHLPYSVVTREDLDKPSDNFQAALDKYLAFTKYKVTSNGQ